MLLYSFVDAYGSPQKEWDSAGQGWVRSVITRLR